MASALRKTGRRAQVLLASGVARGPYAASLLWLASAAASELASAGHGSLGLATALVLALAALPAVHGAAEALGFVAGFAAVALLGSVLPETLSAFVAVAGA